MSSADPASSAGAALAAVEQPQATPERPWLGLAYFTEADHDYFYGRDPEVRELSDRVRRASLTVLYGVSGYGKSSLICAGLIPILRKAGYPIVLLRRCYDDLASRPLHGDVIAACASEIPCCTRSEAPEALTLWEFFHDRSQPVSVGSLCGLDGAPKSGRRNGRPIPLRAPGTTRHSNSRRNLKNAAPMTRSVKRSSSESKSASKGPPRNAGQGLPRICRGNRLRSHA